MVSTIWDPGICEWVDETSSDEDEDDDEGNEDEDEDEGNKYRFQDSEAFLAALELYNRAGYSQELVPGGFRRPPVLALVPSREWKCREVAGSHSKPCGRCRGAVDMYYLTNSVDRKYEKMCFGCMDDMLADKYGTDKAAIVSQLRAVRQEQRRQPITGSPLSHYEKAYPNYPVFLRHCRNNDIEAGDRLEMEMAQRHTDAVSRALEGFAWPI